VQAGMSEDLVNIEVDGRPLKARKGQMLIDVTDAAGIYIPRFCYHPKLSVAANCRMCLVEVERAPKPAPACATPVMEGMKVFTKSEKAVSGQKATMEFLLINHPLDCPICDQGGECDLQDQAMAYGVDSTRYQENKRAVEDKYIGPLVKTVMTRCIHCTRCVRFTTEVAGITELGLIGRGEDAEITTYLEKAMTSEMQGNVIDLCPVGALTSRPYEFNARPWELTKTESIDVMDAVGSAIRVDTRGREVMRILPRINEAVNEEWISDKTRFIWDGLKTQRLDQPYLRENGALRPASWAEAFAAISAKVKATRPERIGALAGQLAGAEEMFALKALMASLGSANLDCRYPGSPLHPKNGRASYLFNATIAGIEEADALLIIGANPRKEAAVLNARIRKRFLKGGFKIGLIGEKADLSYPVNYLGAGPESLASLLKAPKDEGAKKPMILIGQGALNRPDGGAILAMAAQLATLQGTVREDWNGFCVLHTEAALVGALDLGFVPGDGGLDTAGMLKAGALDVLFNLGADDLEIPAGAFVIYQGTHGDRGAHRADVILPGAAYTEKSATYVNTEGRVQMTNRAGFPPGDAREDWAILRALSDVLGRKLSFDSLGQLRAALYAAHPHLAAIGEIAAGSGESIVALAKGEEAADKAPLKSAVTAFHLTNVVARASKIMAECAALAAGQSQVAAE
jgi:NADH-quinone oxidoreductase subunit G